MERVYYTAKILMDGLTYVGTVGLCPDKDTTVTLCTDPFGREQCGHSRKFVFKKTECLPKQRPNRVILTTTVGKSNCEQLIYRRHGCRNLTNLEGSCTRDVTHRRIAPIRGRMKVTLRPRSDLEQALSALGTAELAKGEEAIKRTVSADEELSWITEVHKRHRKRSELDRGILPEF